MAGRKIGEIYGEIKLKNTQFVTGLTQSQSKMQKFGNAAKIAFTAIATMGAAAAGAIIKMTSETIRYANEMRKASKETGIAVDKVQELAYAAKQEHANLEGLQKSIGNLTVRLGYANDGLESYIRYFRGLGIEYKNQDGTLRNTIDVFYDIADKAHEGVLSTEDLADITMLFGARAGRDLIPMLRKGSDWFKTMADEAHDLGIIMSEEDVEAVKKLDDKLTALKETVNGLKRAFTLGLIDPLTSIVDSFLEGAKGAGGFREDLRGLGEYFGGLTAKLMDFVNQTRQSMNELYIWLYNQEIKFLGVVEKLPWIGEKAAEWKSSLESLKQGFMDQNAELRKSEGYYDRYITNLNNVRESVEDVKNEYDNLEEKLGDVKLAAVDMIETVESRTPSIIAGIKNVENTTDDAKESVRNYGDAWSSVAVLISDVFGIMNDEMKTHEQKVKDWTRAFIRFISIGLGGPVGAGVALLGGILGFQKGGYVPAALMSPNLPKISEGYANRPSVLVGEGRGEGEMVVPDSKWKDMITVNLSNMVPLENAVVDVMINLPQGKKQQVYRRTIKEAANREGIR